MCKFQVQCREILIATLKRYFYFGRLDDTSQNNYDFPPPYLQSQQVAFVIVSLKSLRISASLKNSAIGSFSKSRPQTVAAEKKPSRVDTHRAMWEKKIERIEEEENEMRRNREAKTGFFLDE